MSTALKAMTRNGAIKRRRLGNHIISDAGIKSGRPVFVGTRIPVTDVLDCVAAREDWDEIIEKFENKISRAALSEAILLASEALVKENEARRKRGPKRRKEMGRFIVADPRICHGRVTFSGSRVFVSSALKMVAKEMDWDAIIWNWHERMDYDGIGEAIRVAAAAFEKYGRKSTLKRAVA